MSIASSNVYSPSKYFIISLYPIPCIDIISFVYPILSKFLTSSIKPLSIIISTRLFILSYRCSLSLFKTIIIGLYFSLNFKSLEKSFIFSPLKQTSRALITLLVLFLWILCAASGSNSFNLLCI